MEMAKTTMDVRTIARLARLELTEEEEGKFGEQLERVLDYIAELKGADIAEVEPMAHGHPVFNVVREDEALPGLDRQVYLKLAPHKANHLVIVPKVVE